MRRALAALTLAVLWVPVRVFSALDDWAALADRDDFGAL